MCLMWFGAALPGQMLGQIECDGSEPLSDCVLITELWKERGNSVGKFPESIAWCPLKVCKLLEILSSGAFG